MISIEWIRLGLWTLGCLLIEGFFSGSEMALVSSDKLRLSHLAAQGDRGAKLALNMASRPDWFFSTTLLGQNLFIVANTVVVTFFIIDHLGPQYEFLALFLSPLILIFGEAVPKSICQQSANRLVTRTTPVVVFFSYVFYPVIWILSKLTLLLLGGMKGGGAQAEKITPELLEFLVHDSVEVPQSLSLPLKNTLLRILNFSRLEVGEIMTPIVDVFSLREQATLREAIAGCLEEPYTTVPVFQKRAHNITGVLKLTELIRRHDLNLSVASLMKPALYVPREMVVKDLFYIFRDEKKNFAVVIDEYGGAVGIVTLEDILEEIVGEIEDEYDEKRISWVEVDAQHYLLEGRVSIDEINEKLRWGLPKDGYTTLTGFLLAQQKKFPRQGEEVRFGNLTFRIEAATARTIDQVLVQVDR